MGAHLVRLNFSIARRVSRPAAALLTSMRDNLDPFRPSGWWDLAGPARGLREAHFVAFDFFALLSLASFGRASHPTADLLASMYANLDPSSPLCHQGLTEPACGFGALFQRPFAVRFSSAHLRCAFPAFPAPICR